MAAVRTGTASQVNGSGGSSSISVTVPADATGAVAFWTHWDESAGETLSALTLGGNAFTFHAQSAEGAVGDEPGTGVAVLTNLPGTGSQTLAWTWSAGGARSEGGGILVVWIKNYNTGDPVRDADVDSHDDSTAGSVTLTTQSTDLVLGIAQKFGADPNISGAASVFINDWNVNSEWIDAGEFTAGASTTTVTHANPDFSCVAAVAIKEAAAGPVTGASDLPITFTVGSTGTPKAYSSSTQAYTATIGSAGTPKAYGSASLAVTVGISSAGTTGVSGPYGNTVLDGFNRANQTGLGDARWSTDYDAAGRSSLDINSNSAKAPSGGFGSNWWNDETFGPNLEVFATLVTLPTTQAARLQVLLASPGTSGVDGYELNYDINDVGVLWLVRIDDGARTDLASDAGNTIAAGDSLALAVNNGQIEGWHKPAAGSWTKVVSTADATYTTAGNLAIAAQNDTTLVWDDFGGGTITPQDATGSSSSVFTVGIDASGTPKAYGASSSTFTMGVSSSGTAGVSPRTAAGGLVYLFGDKDDIVFASASLQVTVGISSAGQENATGSASQAFTLGISSSGTAKAYGAASQAFTFTVGSSGTATERAFGSASLGITVGIDSTPGNITAYGSASLEITVGVDSRKRGLRLTAITDNSLTLAVDPGHTLTLQISSEDNSLTLIALDEETP